MPSRYPEVGRPADPGEEVDQGGMLEAEGAADRPLAGAAVSGAPSDRPGKTVTDSLPLRNAPIPLASPQEFVVCPLMREIPAFRYFWPEYRAQCPKWHIEKAKNVGLYEATSLRREGNLQI